MAEVRSTWQWPSRIRRSPGFPLPELLVTALVQTTFSVGYNLYVGLSPVHRPGLAREVLIWMALTGLAFVIATACIPLIKLAHRLGLMRQVGPTSWGAFYLTVLATCMAGALFRMVAGQALLPDLPGPVLSMDIAISVGLNTWVMLITAEWYRGHLERLSADATRRAQFAAELVHTQQGLVASEDRLRQGLAEFMHGPVQSHLFLAWVRLREGLQTSADLPAALRDASRLLREVRTTDLGKVREVLAGSLPQDSLEEGTTKLAESYGAAVRIEQHWSPEASALARRIAPENQAILLQFAEECLLNALRHASPKRIQVSAKIAGEETLHLSIKDNGRGFQAHAPGSGLGLKMLGRKLEENGGSWTIRSVPGADTEVTMEISAARTPS